MTNNKLKTIFSKTKGHCHFCGDPVDFDKYGCKNTKDLKGAWEADHIIQKGKGGSKSAENCLPACVRCNRLRWHRKGDNLRELLLLGLVAKDMAIKRTKLGKQIIYLKNKRLVENEKRRGSRRNSQ
jgi:hypothetical protein